MIQRTIQTWQALDWQDALKSAISSPERLFQSLELDPAYLPSAQKAAELFPLHVTECFVARMEKGNIHDPLLRQVLPIDAEHHNPPEYQDDPLEEQTFNTMKGLVHKYRSRVLTISTSRCAINCRYCFRRTFDYRSNRMGSDDWRQALAYVQEHPEIDEIILSGGDPLILPDKYLGELLQAMEKLPQLQRVRVHSRLPIVLPSRVTARLLEHFEQSRLDAVWVIHCNHPQEMDTEVREALALANQANITLLNQAVLLKGVNDKVNTQVELSQSLFKNKVLPYYLHLLDRVSGTSHFEVSERETQAIYLGMRTALPGYLLPKLVREKAGEVSKTLINPV